MSNEVTKALGPTSSSGAGGSDPIDQAQRSTEEYKKIAGDSEKAGANDMAYYLRLQRTMMEEQQAYTAVSTIMRARSDASLSAIRNFK